MVIKAAILNLLLPILGTAFAFQSALFSPLQGLSGCKYEWHHRNFVQECHKYRSLIKLPKHQKVRLAAVQTTSESAVGELLQTVSKGIEGTYPPDDVRKIQDSVRELEQLGAGKLYLRDDPSINGYYRVSYVIEGSGPNAGTPVGGGFRYGIGRAFFRTEDTFQHVVNGTTAINMLYFTLLGTIRGCVILRGDILPLPAAERDALVLRYNTAGGVNPDCPQIRFDSPRIFFGRTGALNFAVGPPTTVYLDTTYLDPRIRIGKSLRSAARFIFTRLAGPEAAAGAPADAWRAYIPRPPVSPVALVAYAVGAALFVRGAGGAPAAAGAAAAGAAAVLPRRLVAAGVAVLLVPLLVLLCFSALA